jgi:hypothetical protein
MTEKLIPNKYRDTTYARMIFAGIECVREYPLATSRHRIDLYIPALRWGIEFNGFFHCKSLDEDNRKKELAEKQGILLTWVYPSGQQKRNEERIFYPLVAAALKGKPIGVRQPIWA